jgi:hypothetical protein
MTLIGYQISFSSAHLLLWFHYFLASPQRAKLFHQPSNKSIRWPLTLLVCVTLGCDLLPACVSHGPGPMFWWMAKNLITHDAYNARAAGLLNSPVQIESPQWRMSRIIPSHRPLRAYIHCSPPKIEDYFQCKVTQIPNKDMFIFGSDHILVQGGVQRLCIQHGSWYWKARYSDLRDYRK